MKSDALVERSCGIAGAFSPAVLASSFSIEDMVLTDAIARASLPIGVIALDTGRLHGDTLELAERVRERYAIAIEIFTPDPAAVDQYTRSFGRDAFYQGVALRQRCCEIRKVEPLARALKPFAAWINGRKRFQGGARAEIPVVEEDGERLKFNPFANVSREEIQAIYKLAKLPAHPLVASGYLSVGCMPCSSRTLPDEDARAGRWRGRAKTECGIHTMKAS